VIVKRPERPPDARTDLMTVEGVVARATGGLHVMGWRWCRALVATIGEGGRSGLRVARWKGS
jgi:hypothetical protein